MKQAELLARFCLQKIANVVLGLNVGSEVMLEHNHSEYTLDIALPALQLAIEADGPLHFMRNTHVATGRTMCKPSQRVAIHCAVQMNNVLFTGSNTVSLISTPRCRR